VPSQCPTIQAGIDSASAGDTVLVACGTYYEHDILMKSGICLRSETGQPECVVIDAQQLGRVITCIDCAVETGVEGLTVTGGAAMGPPAEDRCGGGLYCMRSNLAIGSTVFRENIADTEGGGIGAQASSLALEECTFEGNSTTTGAGIRVRGGNASVTGCIFLGNEAIGAGGGATFFGCLSQVTDVAFYGNSAVYGGGTFCFESSMSFSGCIFSENSAVHRGGGAHVVASAPTFTNCHFQANSGQGGAVNCEDEANAVLSGCTMVDNRGLGSAVYAFDSAYPVLQNSIVAFGTLGRCVYCDATSGATLTCCDVFGNAWGDWVGCIEGQLGINGNIAEDPMFCDPDNNDFHINCSSPCAPDYNPECALIGAWDVGCGSTATKRESWSSLKALYR
jgi:hypothetical protein